MPSRLLVVSDDLFFAARVQAAGTRLGLQVEQVTPADIEGLAGAEDVVVLQVTLYSERQLALLQRLRSRKPAPWWSRCPAIWSRRSAARPRHSAPAWHHPPVFAELSPGPPA